MRFQVVEADAWLSDCAARLPFRFGIVTMRGAPLCVQRAVANAQRCRASCGRLFQSAEDLTNIPVLALQQDLVTAASLGLDHIERNGHHYFAGLSRERTWVEVPTL